MVLDTGCHGYYVDDERLPWQSSCNTSKCIEL